MIQAIKKAYPILDEKGRPCTFPTFASQVYMEDGTSVESAIQDVILNNNNTDDAAKLGGKAPEYYLQPRNLLDNSELLIAQAGFMGMHGSNAYLADRWMADDPSYTSYDENTKTITFTAASSPIIVDQKVSHNVAGKTLTLAIKASNVTGSIILSEQNVQAGHRDVHIVEGITCYSVTGGEGMHVRFWSKNGGSMRIEWIALYEGEYTVETLPPYVSKGYGAELAECQRYFLTGVGAHTVGHSGVMTSKEFYINISTPSVMRTTPTVTLDVADNVVFGTTSGYAVCNVTDIKSVGKQSNGIFIILGLASEPPQHYAVGSTFGTLLTLSADL